MYSILSLYYIPTKDLYDVAAQKGGIYIVKDAIRTMLLKNMAHIIRTERRKSCMSMEQLAEISNVSLQTIKDIEHAKRACQIDTLVSIASALGLSTDYILGLSDIISNKDTSEFGTVYNSLSQNQKDFLREIAKLMLVTPNR